MWRLNELYMHRASQSAQGIVGPFVCTVACPSVYKGQNCGRRWTPAPPWPAFGPVTQLQIFTSVWHHCLPLIQLGGLPDTGPSHQFHVGKAKDVPFSHFRFFVSISGCLLWIASERQGILNDKSHIRNSMMSEGAAFPFRLSHLELAPSGLLPAFKAHWHMFFCV